jgi:hypothetical protein
MDDQRRDQLTRATSSLREWLASVEFSDLSRSAVTALLTDRVIAWGRSHGFEAQTEVEAVATKRKPYGRQIGLLDVLCSHRSGQQIAVEIDNTNKVWSIEKLAAEADSGKLALWVKWGAPAGLSLIPEKVGIVELPADWINRAGHVMYSRAANHVQHSSTATLVTTTPSPAS